jgi:hypothetical protein
LLLGGIIEKAQYFGSRKDGSVLWNIGCRSLSRLLASLATVLTLLPLIVYGFRKRKLWGMADVMPKGNQT